MPKVNIVKSQSPASLKQSPEVGSVKPPSQSAKEGIAIEEQKSARDRIRWTLLKRISEGLYRPGERLKEMKLAQEFEVSQAPVREVFRELETLGLLVSRRYHGTHVREISSQENRDTYQLRGYLEEIAVQLIPPAKVAGHNSISRSIAGIDANGCADWRPRRLCASQHAVSSEHYQRRVEQDVAEGLGLS